MHYVIDGTFVSTNQIARNCCALYRHRIACSQSRKSSTLSDKEHKIIRKLRSLENRSHAKVDKELTKLKWAPSIKNSKIELTSDKNAISSKEQLKREVSNTFSNINKKVNPSIQEKGWDQLWTNEVGLSDLINKDRDGIKSPKEQQLFTMILPPPNVTGELHMGHALDLTLQDVVARYQTLQGKHVVWVPGCDHAGIATQMVAERSLRAQPNSPTKHSLGREQFVDYIKCSTVNSCDKINQQIKRLGAYINWNLHTYTMSEEYSLAVKEAFRLLFNQSLITREASCTRWSPTLQSVISDSEVNMKEIKPGKNRFTEMGSEFESNLFGLMFYVKYDIVGSENNETVSVATTRPETMFGDVALVVHPNDNRYANLIGKRALNPVNNYELEIFADSNVNPDFGTGVMKLTPAHNPFDEKVSQNLGITVETQKTFNVYDEQCRLKTNCGDLAGVNRFEAREAILALLRDQSRIVKVEERSSLLPFCARSGDLLEFILVDQWFLDTKELFERHRERILHDVVPVDKSGIYKKSILDMENSSVQSKWCLSRQIWWGHPIPAYRVSINGQKQGYVSESDYESALEEATVTYNCHRDDIVLEADPDVLDTWFSSAIYPLASLGWPQNSAEQLINSGLYPSQLLITGKDITRHWVHKMLMLCTEFANGQVPFRSLYLHGMIKDPFGRKMSKSLGNVIDPLDIVNGVTAQQFRAKNQEKIDKGQMENFEIDYFVHVLGAVFGGKDDGYIPTCGADSLRMMLLRDNRNNAESFNFKLDSIKFALEFHNKLRNVANLIVKQAEIRGDFILPTHDRLESFSPKQITLMDELILKKLSKLQTDCIHCYDSLDFQKVVNLLNIFLRKDFSATYLMYFGSAMKDPQLKLSSYCTAVYVLYRFIKLCHPLVPFYSEKLYQQLKFAVCTRLSTNLKLESVLKASQNLSAPVVNFDDVNRVELLENVYNGELFLDEVIEQTNNLVDQVLKHINQRLLLQTRHNNKSNKYLFHVFVPNYPLVTLSVQTYFKRLVEMKTYNLEVVFSDECIFKTNSAAGGGGVHNSRPNHQKKNSSTKSTTTSAAAAAFVVEEEDVFEIESNDISVLCKIHVMAA